MSIKLDFQPAVEHSELLASSVFAHIQSLPEESAQEIRVAEIDPQFTGGIEFCETYGSTQDETANCLVVECVRNDVITYAACLVPVAAKKIDFNGVVRRYMNARRVSFAPLELIVETTGMEYGGITVVGLPPEWQILVAPSLMEHERIVIGSGIQNSKISMPTALLRDASNVAVVEGICQM